MSGLRPHAVAAIALAAATYAAAVSLDAQNVPRSVVCAATLSLRLAPSAAPLDELRSCLKEPR